MSIISQLKFVPSLILNKVNLNNNLTASVVPVLLLNKILCNQKKKESFTFLSYFI